MPTDPNDGGSNLSLEELYTRSKGVLNELARATIERLIAITSTSAPGAILPGTSVEEVREAFVGDSYIQLGPGEHELWNLNIPTDGDSIDAPMLEIVGHGNCIVHVPAITDAAGMVMTKRRFVRAEGIRWVYDGPKNDGKNTDAVRTMGNNARFRIQNMRAVGFSRHGFNILQPLSASFENIEAHNCGGYGFHTDRDPVSLRVPTTIWLRQAYFSGMLRGFNAKYLVNAWLEGLITEECGSNSTEDGAFHLENGCRGVVLAAPHFEANFRHYVTRDSRWTWIGGMDPINQGGGLTAASVNTWSGVASIDRGITRIHDRYVATRSIRPDSIGGQNLDVGDLAVALGAAIGDSVFGGKWGGMSPPEDIPFGPTTENTFTTIKTFAAGEFSGTGALTGGAARAAYLAFLYVGETDRSKFSGLYAIDSAAGTPTVQKLIGGLETANLQMSGLNLQISVSDAANNYGRRGKLRLFRFGPLG